MDSQYQLERAPNGETQSFCGRILRGLYMAAGAIFVVLAIAGIVLPLLPSTPFVLLAAGCFGRSSPRTYRWLLTNRYFGALLRAYRQQRGATARSKAFAIATIWAGIGASILIFSFPLMVAVLVFVIASVVSIYLLHLRTIPAESQVPAADGRSWG